jgi:cytochrome c oxidase assembly factor 5
MVERHKASDCLRPPLVDTIPTKCQQLKKGYGQCKRGMVDMRKRFRGNQAFAMGEESADGKEGSVSNGSSRMLYAGKPAFAPVVKETAGMEKEAKDWREVENEKYREGR